MSNEKLKVNSEKMNFVRLSRCHQFYYCYPQIFGSVTQEFKNLMPSQFFGSLTQKSDKEVNELLPIRRSQTIEPGNDAYQLKDYNAGIVQLPTAQLRLLTNSDWGIVQTPSAQLGERNKSYFSQNFI